MPEAAVTVRAWTPELLERMRTTGDPLADDTYARARCNGDLPRINKIFKSFAADDAQLPDDAPQEFKDFIRATRALPPRIDVDSVGRGADVLLGNATLVALALLLASLPIGYAAPRLSNVLHLSGNMEKRPYRRCLGVLQMMVNICRDGAFKADGSATVTAQKLRLLHAGVREIVRKSLPEYQSTFGTPISQLDMVYTIMTFSVVVVDGLQRLGLDWTPQEQEDYFHLWQMYGEMQGIRPDWMPASLADGRAFCEAYATHYRNADENPDGVKLASADLAMMRRLIPWPMKLLGLGTAPTVYLLRMLGPEAAARIGVKHLRRHTWAEWLALRLPVFWHRFWKHAAPEAKAHSSISRLFFNTLIVNAWGREVTFAVPKKLQDLRQLS